jgi:hypothetical protein
MSGPDVLPGGAAEPVLIYDRISANRRETWLLMLVFIAIAGGLATVLAYALAAGGLLAVRPGHAAVAAPFSYYASSSVALAVSGAPVTRPMSPS